MSMPDCILIAAYDVGTRTSEGYVVRNLLNRLNQLNRRTRIILITRRNNVAELRGDACFNRNCPNINLIGFDLPMWAAWWKIGPRFYGLYAYLWQVAWPFVVKRRKLFTRRLSVVHTLNFHNDSYPNMGWILGRPTVWGPINHNELAASWRMNTWPVTQRLPNKLKMIVRRILWRFDPLLALAVRNTGIILSAGSWVDHRLGLSCRGNVCRRSQLGVDKHNIPRRASLEVDRLRLVSAGRLDWIKGLDIAIAALVLLPSKATLTLIGDGPCREFLENYAIRLGVIERVSFHSTVSREELLLMYENFDIFVFTSAEAGGLSWVEALATGLPVVGFEGPTEISEKSRSLSGISISPVYLNRTDSIRALAETIEASTFINHDPKSISDEVRFHYDWGRLASEIQEAYRTLSSETS